MGLSASQGRMLLLTARKSDLEFRAQQISQKRLMLSQQLEEIAVDYEESTSNRQMKISLANVSAGEDKNAKSSVNLTYAALISGTLHDPNVAKQAGIQAYSRTEVGDYASNNFYRLVDTSGAIVVSSAEEIPTSGTNDKKSTTDALQYSNIANLYTTTTSTVSGGETTTGKPTYYVVAKENSALYDVLGSNKETASVQVDVKQGIVLVTGTDGTQTYYNTSDGAKVESASLQNTENAILIKDISKYKSTTIESKQVDYKLDKGADGIYTLKDEDGVVINRYVVDSSLKYGATGSSGDTNGPNYIQDCIRNGKYLIQQGKTDLEGEDSTKIVWRNLAWDATTNISDSYYSDDDDAAKAKYDRLQGQIQTQDKKLELELDNIETQRNAVNTETDSVKKVITDNVEKTFKTFA